MHSYLRTKAPHGLKTWYQIEPEKTVFGTPHLGFIWTVGLQISICYVFANFLCKYVPYVPHWWKHCAAFICISAREKKNCLFYPLKKLQ